MDAGKSNGAKPGLSRYINRELSWLEFNARVLGEAIDPTVPLLERLKFLCIFNSNLDEFFMVRVAAQKKMVEEKIIPQDSPDDLTPTQTLRALRERTQELLQLHNRCLTDQVLPGLAENGIQFADVAKLTSTQKERLKQYFEEQIFPVLTPLAVDPAHPYPFLTNLALYLVVTFKNEGHGEKDSEPLIGLVEIPSVISRLIPVYAGKQEQKYVFVEDLIAEHLSSLYIGVEVDQAFTIRVTRNLDYELLENEVQDLLKAVQKHISDKQTQELVRLEVSDAMPDEILDKLQRALNIHDDDVYCLPPRFDTTGLMQLYGLEFPELKDPPFNPRLPARFSRNEGIFDIIAERDVLVHHPFDSFYPIIEFLQSAAHHPDVVAIKQTLYRTSGDSPIIKALIEAAENGKHVTAVIELKARFDEKNNIVWARRLQRAGVNVVFGFVGYKTHAKAALVIKREKGALVRYCHLATGNYNSKTAKLYTDSGIFTKNEAITADVALFFNFITGFNILSGEKRIRDSSALPTLNILGVSPVGMREMVLKSIDQEIRQARDGKPSMITAKMNALVDKPIIDKLYEASQAGVRITLIVRGVCCLRPGVPELSENIRVISIIDRFLEHTRIFYYHNAGEPNVYMSSADWMPRNMNRRFELLFPILDPELKERVKAEMLDVYLKDNSKAWQLQGDAHYQKLKPRGSEPDSRAQENLIALVRRGGLKSLPYDEAVKYHRGKRTKGRPILGRPKS